MKHFEVFWAHMARLGSYSIGKEVTHWHVFIWHKSTCRALRNLNLQLRDYDEMFLIKGKCVKITYVVRIGLSLSGGYIVGGDRGIVHALSVCLSEVDREEADCTSIAGGFLTQTFDSNGGVLSCFYISPQMSHILLWYEKSMCRLISIGKSGYFQQQAVLFFWKIRYSNDKRTFEV